MKKLIALVLAVVFAAALVPVSVIADEFAVIDTLLYANVALGKKYTTNATAWSAGHTASDWDTNGNIQYKLTDGLYNKTGVSANSAGSFAGPDKSTDYIIDLEKAYPVKQVQCDLGSEKTWGLQFPQTAKVTAFYSNDGEAWTSFGEADTEFTNRADAQFQYGVFTFTLEEEVSARYIKLNYVVTGLGCLFPTEFAVYANQGLPEGQHNTITKGDVVYLLDYGTEYYAENVKRTFGDKVVTVKNANGEEKNSGYLATGDVITAGEDVYTALIYGDINSDGKVNAMDYVALRLGLMGKKDMNDAQNVAADLHDIGDESVNALDYVRLRRYLIGQFEQPHQNIVSTPKPTTFTPATINKTSSEVTMVLDNGTFDYKVKLLKTAWGTWRLNGMNVVTDGREIVLGAGSTDYEYVMTAGSSASSMAFCGGNHEFEKLISLEFYDAKTGELLGNGSNNFTDTANGIRIVQKTQVLFPDKKVDGVNVPFVNVTRKYLVNESTVWLECDFDFIETAYIERMYTCMFPTPKATGNNIIFNLVDGTQVHKKTALSGTASGTDYASDYFRPYAAPSVEIYGDNTPEWRAHVEIYDPELMADGFTNSNCVMFWDMNSIANKLYFTMGSNRTITASKGTTWRTLASWGAYHYEG